MNLLDTITDFLKGSVGNNLENKPDDVRATKRKLYAAGFYDQDDDHEYITHEMDQGIRRYQRDKGLQEDGRLYPSGETERSLFETVTGLSADRFFTSALPQDTGSIGFGGNISGTFSTPSFNPMKKTTHENTVLKSNPVSALLDFVDSSVLDNIFDKTDQGHRTYDVASRQMLNDMSQKADHDAVDTKSPVREKQKPETSKISSQPRILNNYDDEYVKAEIRKHENVIHYMYKDNAKDGGKVTTGTGILIDTVDKALALPFKIKDQNGKIRDATQDEIRAAYKKVDAVKQPADSSQAYGARAFDPERGGLAKARGFDNLFLTDVDEKKLFDKAVREHAGLLRGKFKDFESFPPPAQRVLLDLQFNTGLDKEKWPKLVTGINTRDWVAASDEVNRTQVSSDRNQWARKEMLKAAEFVKNVR